ncbi:MAG: oxaloacetate decarboxylase gamma subunit [Pseudomonadales bacterium]|jgi:oxaloacetate decarboxylase gamma subunit
MEQVSLMQQGIDLMLFGMGTVFTFLMVLIGAILVMSALVKLMVGDQLVNQPPTNARVSNSNKPAQGELTAVIMAAIEQHKANKK